MTDAPDWTVPQTNANAIAATGVPLLSGKRAIGSNTIVLPALGISTITPFAVTQPWYEVQLSAFESGAGAASGLSVSFIWQDGITGGTVQEQTWYLWPGLAAGGHLLGGGGPTSADQLTLQFENWSAAMQYSVTYNLWQSSHLPGRHDIRSTTYLSSASGGTITTFDTSDTLIGFQSVSVGAGATNTTELPLYAGPAMLYADTGSGTTDFTLTIQDSANPNGEGTGTRIMQFKSDANGKIFAAVQMPRYQCRIGLTNGNAAAKFLTYSLHTVE